MKVAPIVGVAALALAACQAEDTAENNMSDVTAIGEDEGGTIDPATTDLNIDASSEAVDQAVNQTDAQSDLGNSIEETADSAGNEM